jgi:hypothetical protein
VSAQTHDSSVNVHDQTRSHRYGLAAMLLGMTFPVLVLLMLYPNGRHGLSLIVPVYLAGIFLIAMGAFLVSVFENGDPTGLTVDVDNKVIILEKTGFVAYRELPFPFAEVSNFRLEKEYDADGYDTYHPVMTLKSRERIRLPDGTTEADLKELTLLIKS